jgi:hypothetical protein
MSQFIYLRYFMLEIQKFISMSNAGKDLFSQIYLHIVLNLVLEINIKQSTRVTAGVIRDDR